MAGPTDGKGGLVPLCSERQARRLTRPRHRWHHRGLGLRRYHQFHRQHCGSPRSLGSRRTGRSSTARRQRSASSIMGCRGSRPRSAPSAPAWTSGWSKTKSRRMPTMDAPFAAAAIGRTTSCWPSGSAARGRPGGWFGHIGCSAAWRTGRIAEAFGALAVLGKWAMTPEALQAALLAGVDDDPQFAPLPLPPPRGRRPPNEAEVEVGGQRMPPHCPSGSRGRGRQEVRPGHPKNGEASLPSGSRPAPATPECPGGRP